MSVSAKELQKVVEDFRALAPEDRKAILHIMDRLLQAGPHTDAEGAQTILDAARETGNATLLRRAEAQAARFHYEHHAPKQEPSPSGGAFP